MLAHPKAVQTKKSGEDFFFYVNVCCLCVVQNELELIFARASPDAQ
jgi:hypothetical protein